MLIFLFLVELAKWLGVSFLVSLAVYWLLKHGLKKERTFATIFVPVFIIVIASPFLYWKFSFAVFADKKAAICELETYAKIYNEPPRDMVAFRGKSPRSYISYPSGDSKNWSILKRYNLNSLVIFDRFEKRALDGISGKWKSLEWIDRPDARCEAFDHYTKKNMPYYNENPNQCIVVEVLDNINSVNFIDSVTKRESVKVSHGFAITKRRSQIINSDTEEIFIDVQQVLGDFPRFPYNFYAGFVSTSKSCKKADALRKDNVKGPVLKSIVFNSNRVKELKEKGYGVQ